MEPQQSNTLKEVDTSRRQKNTLISPESTGKGFLKQLKAKTAPGDHGLSSSRATVEAVVCFDGASVCVGTRLGLYFAVCGLQLALWAADIPEGSSEQVAALSPLAGSKDGIHCWPGASKNS